MRITCVCVYIYKYECVCVCVVITTYNVALADGRCGNYPAETDARVVVVVVESGWCNSGEGGVVGEVSQVPHRATSRAHHRGAQVTPTLLPLPPHTYTPMIRPSLFNR